MVYRRILPLCRRAGIARLGDLTGLDRIGLPVVQALRPEALSEVTALGRGLTVAEAAVGAIMEALERYFAERIATDAIVLATADELKIADGLFGNMLSPTKNWTWRRQAIPWVTGIDLTTGAEQPVPLELVHTCYTDPPPDHDGLFFRTTTGIACQLSFHRAVVHALFECIERDAMARAFETHGFFDRMRVSPNGLGARFERISGIAATHGISLGLWHASSPTGVPVIWCQTIETTSGEPLLALPTEGYCAAPSLEDAASGALLEALAARAGAISGARDDQTKTHYRKSTDTLVAAARELILDQPSLLHDPRPACAEVSDLADLIDRASSAGLGPIIAVPVGSDETTGVKCVRTLLPGARVFSIVR
nr:YcaO-like family protein [Fererhizobium litorale]